MIDNVYVKYTTSRQRNETLKEHVQVITYEILEQNDEKATTRKQEREIKKKADRRQIQRIP